MNKKIASLLMFVSGILFCLASAVLMFFENDINLSIKITLLIVGIGLLGTSSFRLIK